MPAVCNYCKQSRNTLSTLKKIEYIILFQNIYPFITWFHKWYTLSCIYLLQHGCICQAGSRGRTQVQIQFFDYKNTENYNLNRQLKSD